MGRPAATALPVAATVGRHIAQLRANHGWTLRALEARTIAAGHRITHSGLAEIESGRNTRGGVRSVTVDQLIVLARVFQLPAYLLLDPRYDPTATPPRSATTRRPQNSPQNGHNRA